MNSSTENEFKHWELARSAAPSLPEFALGHWAITTFKTMPRHISRDNFLQELSNIDIKMTYTGFGAFHSTLPSTSTPEGFAAVGFYATSQGRQNIPLASCCKNITLKSCSSALMLLQLLWTGKSRSTNYCVWGSQESHNKSKVLLQSSPSATQEESRCLC